MEIKVTKGDIVWSYLAQFFNLATGLITLPLILKLLSAEEVGFNYILISINSIVVLFDMGFSGQFSRYLTYIFSGAQKIQKEGIAEEYSERMNERLLACTIATARRIYLIISLVASVFLLSFGSWYVYDVTDHFKLIPDALSIWIVFALSSFFNIYFLYYNAFLQGRGLVKESKQAAVYSKIVQLAVTFAMLFAGFGLLAVVVANLIAPFAFRIYAHKKFFSEDIKTVLSRYKIESSEIKEVFNILLYNAKKMGVIGILGSAIGYASTLVIGKYMSLSDVGSFGLMVQLTGIVSGVATIHFFSIVPKLASLMVKKDIDGLRRNFGLSMFFFITIMALGMIAMLIMPPVFRYFNFNTQLPAYYIIILYYIYKFFEQNQSLYSQMFLVENDLRFFPCAVWTGIISFIALWGSLYLGYGLLGVVLAQCLPLYAYAAWIWPIEATKKYGINTIQDIVVEPVKQIKQIIYARYL